MSAGAWRIALADALDEQAGDIRRALGELDNAHAVLEARGSDRACHELRVTAATLRSEAAAIESEARALRADAAGDGKPPGLPLALTTRHARRRTDGSDTAAADRDR